MIVDSFNHWEFTVITDSSEDLLILGLKPNQPCATGLGWLKGLCFKTDRILLRLLSVNYKKKNSSPLTMIWENFN